MAKKEKEYNKSLLKLQTIPRVGKKRPELVKVSGTHFFGRKEIGMDKLKKLNEGEYTQ